MNLEAVQQLLYARSIDTAVAIDELSYLQPLVTLNRIQQHSSFTCSQRVEVAAGQGSLLQAPVLVGTKTSGERLSNSKVALIF